MGSTNYIQQHYDKLIGFTITEVIILDEEGTDEIFSDGQPRVILIANRGEEELIIEVLSDAEGNGTGFLDIMEKSEGE